MKSFVYAFRGIKAAFNEEPNFKIHVGITSLVIVAALLLGFSAFEWIVLTLTIAFVLVCELFNTTIESIVNLVSPEIKEEAKIAKDVSAAAVLLSAFAAALVGLILFLPKII